MVVCPLGFRGTRREAVWAIIFPTHAFNYLPINTSHGSQISFLSLFLNFQFRTLLFQAFLSDLPLPENALPISILSFTLVFTPPLTTIYFSFPFFSMGFTKLVKKDAAVETFKTKYHIPWDILIEYYT